MSSKILVVDDDRFLLENLRKLLSREGYDTEGATSGEEGLNLLSQSSFDLVVLDVGLPGIDGITTCRRLRARWHTPVIMLTARSDSMDKVIGLEVGADDYLTKPFDGHELVARVRAQLRRCNEYQSEQPVEDNLIVGDLTIDYERRDVLVKGAPVELTNREFELVSYLAKNLNRAVSREVLFERVWGYELDFNSNSLDVYMYRIRKRIEADPNKPKYLQTMRGYGYKLASPES